MNSDNDNNINNTIEEYYKRYAPMVFRRCCYLLKDEELSRDAMQDIFVKLLNVRSRINIREVSNYILRMTTNHCISIINKRNKTKKENGNDMLNKIASCEDIEDKVITKDLLDRLFCRVPISSKEIAIMVYIDKMTYEEVSKELNMSISNIKKRLNKLNQVIFNIERNN